MFLSKYGVARHIYIPVVKRAVVDFAVSADWTPGAGDVKISKDGGAAANVTNLPVAITMGNTAIWDFSITATEMQAAQVVVTVVDSATKAVEDQSFIIETYGNASAQGAFDLGTASTAQTGDSFARLGAPAGASVSADVAAVKVDTAAVKVQTDKLTFTVSNQIDANVLDWKSATAPAMTGDAFARLGAPAGASVSVDIAAVKTDTAAVKVKTDSLTFTTANKVDATIQAAADFAQAAADKNADALLNRDMSTGTDSGSPTVRTPRQALRFLRNKWAIASGTLTVSKEDDTTTSWTSTVSTTTGAAPVTGNDPA